MHRHRVRLAALLLLPLSAWSMSAPEQLQLADGLYARGLYDLAAREYLALSTNAATDEAMDVVLFRLAESYRHLGDKPKAAEQYRRLITEHTNSTYLFRAEFRRAELFATGGQYLEAINFFRTLLDRNPPDDVASSALYYLGYSQAKLLMTREAEKAYRRLITEYPKTPFFSHACVGLAELYAAQGGRDDEIRDLLTKATKRPETPRVGAEAWFMMGDLAYRKGQYAESAKAFEQLLMRFPDSERTTEARLPAAWSFYHVRRYTDALKMADNALTRAPDERLADWIYLKANCQRQLERDAEARATYQQLLAQHPDSALRVAATYESALLAYRTGDFAGAISLGEGVSATNGLAVDLKWLLAESYAGLMKADRAAAYYQQVVDEHPDSDRAPLAQFRLARIAQDAGELETASMLFRGVAGKFPKGDLAAAALLASASCRVGLKQYDEAQKDWAALLNNYPDYKEMDDALYWKAQVEIETGKDAEARATLERLLQEFPKSRWLAEAHYLRGALLEKADQLDVADFHYRAALARKPDVSLSRKIQFRRIAVMQRQGKQDEAANLIQSLLGTPARKEMPPALLDWLARFNLQKEEFAKAEEAAESLVAVAPDPEWRQVGWYLVGRGRHGAGKADAARKAYEQALAEDVSTREGLEAALYLGQVSLEEGQQGDARRFYALAAERAMGEDLGDIRAQSYLGLGKAAAGEENWEEAARYFLSVGVLFDDAELTPESLYLAAQALDRAGKAAQRDDVLRELTDRYPESSWARKSGS
jgi:TolA-binding protein